MEGRIFFPLFALAGGAVLLVMGLIRRGRARAYKKIPCVPAGSAAGGERRFISGKAHSPVQTGAPVSKAACVFYLEKVDRKEPNYSRQGGDAEHWVRRENNVYGAFFLRDGSGEALVVPTAASVDLSKPEASESDDLPLSSRNSGAVRRSELIIAEGETVTALGTPGTLGEFLLYLRRNTDRSLPADLLAELLRLEKEPGTKDLPCFFGGGIERISDRSYGDYIAGTESSGTFLLQLGGLLAAGGAVFLVYSLKLFGGGAAEI